jgi:hypothetical protein
MSNISPRKSSSIVTHWLIRLHAMYRMTYEYDLFLFFIFETNRKVSITNILSICTKFFIFIFK